MPITKGLDKLIKYNNRSIKDLTTTPTAAGGGDTGVLVHIKTLTASSSATLSFVHGTDGVVLDSTYPIYKFEFINIHPSHTGQKLAFNVSIDGGSNYNVAKTSTFIVAYHKEDNAATTLGYDTGFDLAQGTGFQNLTSKIGHGGDENGCGTLQIFNPSSTTFVKHFICSSAHVSHASFAASYRNEVAGYANTTSAVNAVRFQMTSNNIESGKIKLYGIKDS